MNNSKVAVAVSKTASIVQMLGGIVLVFLFGICTIAYLTDKEYAADTGVAFLIVCLLFDALGIWLITLSRKKAKLIKEFKKYVRVISQNPNGYIPYIASSLGTSEDAVKNNLKLMIKKKYFSNAFIDCNSDCIVIANKQKPVSTPVQQPTVSTNTNAYSHTAAPAIEMVTVKCKGCGGINTIQKGAVGECDYCGSSIKGE
jgi:hypothetical protein